ncbi:cold shock domain-containing protein [Streptomyces piniterrae]|uniref:Cold shock domain-containing protein n=1 Tax=Streptomyces piniterrae TaxID=2571125 RepID=A0A4U0NWK6_9ACTN|nr:cold shock domain-containing protein [Streptomyces piniterrae]TJZ59157.1 cold shock domain-containing protein [Streptomyces piniterrae]
MGRIRHGIVATTAALAVTGSVAVAVLGTPETAQAATTTTAARTVQVQTQIGVVLWYNIEKGYGFIRYRANGQQKDIFVHFTQIMGRPFPYLRAGEMVMFAVAHGPRGDVAAAVRIIASP